MRRLLLVMLFAAVAAAPASVANAYWPYGGYLGYGPNYAYAASEPAPHYAYHPPVYYSAPTARSYGHSPFAYPGYVRTPSRMVVRVRPRRPAPKPVMIVNPYYQASGASGDETASNGDEASRRVQPQVIYPAAMAQAE